MRNIPCNSIPRTRLRCISSSPCLIGVLFLFSAVLILEQLAYGAFTLDGENPGFLRIKSHIQRISYEGEIAGGRNQVTVLRCSDHTTWNGLYAQNMQPGDYYLQTPDTNSQYAPAATTDRASNVTSGSATLQGTVNARGFSTDAWFQYRVVGGQSKSTFSTKTVIGSSDTEVSIRIIELLPGATYYYRLVARNDYGTTYGSELSFTTVDKSSQISSDITPPAGSVNINGGASCTNSLTVTVNLSATDDTGVTGYYLSANAVPPSRYTTGWTSTIPFLNYKEDVSYTLSDGDGRNTVYAWFRDASGNISDAASASIIVDTTPPAITIVSPTSDQTYTTTNGTINISGNASDDINEISNITWKNSKGRREADRHTIDWIIPNINLSRGDNVITIRASDSVGNAETATIIITYTGANNPPSVITGLATNITTDLATLTGAVNAMGLPTTVWFQYGTDTEHYSGASPIQGIGDGVNDTPVSNRISGLQAGTTYYYRLVAQNSIDTVSGDEMTFRTLPPKGKISGSVMSSEKGRPIESVRLRLKGTKARKKSFMITLSDANGFFIFKDLDADKYDISVIKTGFKSANQRIELGEGEGKKIEIKLERTEGGNDQPKDVKNDQQEAN